MTHGSVFSGIGGFDLAAGEYPVTRQRDSPASGIEDIRDDRKE